jgi:hypothetical protein
MLEMMRIVRSMISSSSCQVFRDKGIGRAW